MYHVMSRGDRREDIFLNDADRRTFLRALGEACAKTGWEIHAYVLMSNHFHVVLETPQPNLSLGMKWLLGTYTQRSNRRWRRWGHLFGGRYKAQCIDERTPSYLRSASDYVHLNPARARLLAPDEPLESYAWSSFPAYLKPSLRAAWLRTDRLLGEHGKEDSRSHRRLWAKGMGGAAGRGFRRRRDVSPRLANRSERFSGVALAELGRRGVATERARERRETDEQLALRLIGEALQEAGWKESALVDTLKGHPVKVALPRVLRSHTPMTRAWIARRLSMGSASYVSALLSVYNDPTPHSIRTDPPPHSKA